MILMLAACAKEETGAAPEEKETETEAKSVGTVVMPDVCGLEENKAIKSLKDLGFISVSSEHAASTVAPAEWIVETQNVAAGKSIPKDTEIKLICIPVYEMIDVCGLEETEAVNALNAAGFENVNVLKEEGTEVEPKFWRIEGQSVSRGTLLSGKSEILLESYAAYEMINVCGMTFKEAKELLQGHGITNVKKADTKDNEWDDNRLQVANQNISEGEIVTSNTLIKLECLRLHYLYLDLSSDWNLLFSKYTISLHVDDEEVGQIPNGEAFTKLLSVTEGKHRITAYNQENHSVTGNIVIDVDKDLTFKSVLKHDSSEITFTEQELIPEVAGATLEMPDVVGSVLSNAYSTLEAKGFINVKDYVLNDSVWDRNNWTVIEQNITPGEKIDKNTEIVLTVKKTAEIEYETHAVTNAIALIDLLGTVSINSKTAIGNARAAYESMTPELKAKVTNYDVLVKAEETYAKLYAEDLNSRIDAVDPEKVTLKDEAALDSLYDEYKSLSTTEQPKITNYTKLSKALSKIQELKKEEKSRLAKEEAERKAKLEEESRAKEEAEKKNDEAEKIGLNRASDAVSYSTNNKADAKKGNSGVFAYCDRSGSYEIYYIIDFDNGYVYSFTEGNGGDSCDKVKITSGNLNSRVIITYHDGDDTWQMALYFPWQNQPDRIIVDLGDGFTTTYTSTNLNSALKLMAKKRIVAY